MNTLFGSILVLTFLLGANISAFAAPQIIDVRNKKPVAYKQLIDDLKGSNVTFIGETHDVKMQHKNQLDIIQSLHEKNDSVAIGLEMFSTDYQQQLDDWSNGRLDEQDFKKIYAKNWSYDWQLYRDIFIYARDNRIPMIALNVPKPIISKVVRQGSAALNDMDKKEIPPHISWTLNAAQTEYLRRISAQVFGNKAIRRPPSNFCEAQALRNSVMAWAISKYEEKNPKSDVIVLTGTWHAIKNGAPEQLKVGSPGTELEFAL